MSEDSKFWSAFGKFSAVVTTIAALGGLWLIYDSKSPDLVLYVESQENQINPILDDAVKTHFQRFEYSELSDAIDSEFPSKDLETLGATTSLRRFIKQYHKESWAGIVSYKIPTYGGFSRLVLYNNGNTTAKDIRISVGHRGIVAISNDDMTITTAEFAGIINVPELRASSQISARIWTPQKLSEYDLKDVLVTYNNGVGKVTWSINATGLVRYLEEYPFFLPLAIFLIFMFGTIWGTATTTSGKSSKATEGQDVSQAADVGSEVEDRNLGEEDESA